jgi:hypothetical protein
LLGVVTKSDIFRALVSIFDSPIARVRITFDAAQGEDVFKMIAEMAQRRKVRVLTLITVQTHGHPVCIVEVSGEAVDKLLDDVWKSHHRVLSVLRL